MNILDFQSYYLVGIKGVAMTALAQCLVDAGKTVAGCDVAEDFVTEGILKKLPIHIDDSFTSQLPQHVECAIHTAAHQGALNPIVQNALENNVPVFTYAQAVAQLFNQKKGIGVSGVGGKSTVSAMITWVMEHLAESSGAPKPSFIIGVGDIPGLHKTGAWNSHGEYFVAEADDYVADPTVQEQGKVLEPKFWYLRPFVTVCTNLKFDHPDVYTDFNQTQAAFLKFFQQTNPQGFLVFNGEDSALKALTSQLTDKTVITYGEDSQNDVYFTDYASREGSTSATVHTKSESAQLTLTIPARFNIMNALAALSVVTRLGLPLSASCQALASFNSTKRRFEYLGEKKGIKYYDDYGHHPHEVASTIQALNEWFPQAHKVIAFQPHTYSRTKELFSEFVTAFAQAQEVVLTDIFASARENADTSVSSDSLASAIAQAYPHIKITNAKTNQALAQYFHSHLSPGSVAITIGAGDIYQAHELV